MESDESLRTFTLRVDPARPRPYFAELPYYLWGDVNYDSEGNCARPTDRGWSWLELTHRGTDHRITVSQKSEDPTRVTITGDAPEAERAALFLAEVMSGALEGPPPDAGEWDHAAALARAIRVRETFARPELAPFDSDLFWGSWKWVGCYATEFTWVGRWIMQSMLTRDGRAVSLCVEWLRDGTYSPEQSAALRAGLAHLTERSFATDGEWVRWYDVEGKGDFPEPDFDAWFAELKATLGERAPTGATST